MSPDVSRAVPADPRAHRIFVETTGQVAIRAFDVALGVVILGIITRYLGSEDFGRYTTVAALLQLFVTVIDFGLYLTLLRELSASAREKAESIINTVITLRMVSSTAVMVVGVLILWATSYEPAIKWGVLAYAIGYLASTVVSTVTAVYQKHLRMVSVAFVLLLVRIVTLLALLGIVAVHGGLQAIFVASAIIQVVGCCVLILRMRTLPQAIRFQFRFDPVYVRDIVRKTWPLAVTIALNLIYFKADTIFLSVFQPQAAVGLYGASYRVLEIVTTFPHLFMGLVMPILTEHWLARNLERFSAVWRKTFVLFAMITIPMMFGAWVVAEPLMRLIAGPEFVASGAILRVLIVAASAVFFGTLYTYLVLVLDRQKAIIKYFAIVAAGSLIGYAVFIPRFSYWGAAWMTVATEIAIALAAWFLVQQYATLKLPWREIALVSLASAIMAGFTFFLLPVLPIIFTIAAGALLYGILIMSFKVITVADIRQLIRPGHGTT